MLTWLGRLLKLLPARGCGGCGGTRHSAEVFRPRHAEVMTLDGIWRDFLCRSCHDRLKRDVNVLTVSRDILRRADGGNWRVV